LVCVRGSGEGLRLGASFIPLLQVAAGGRRPATGGGGGGVSSQQRRVLTQGDGSGDGSDLYGWGGRSALP